MTVVKFNSMGKSQHVTVSFDCDGKRYSYALGRNGRAEVVVNSDKVIMTPKTQRFINEGIVTFEIVTPQPAAAITNPIKKKTPSAKKSVETTETKNWREDK